MGLVAILALADLVQGTEEPWPQLQRDAAHRGYSPEAIRAPRGFKVGWSVDFSTFSPPEHISCTVQIIAAYGKLFVPTLEGNLYALDPPTGRVVWKFSGGEGIPHTAAAAAGKVFIGTIRGSVLAVDAETGAAVWRWHNGRRTGFSAAPLVADRKLFIGGRGGDFHALDQASGRVLWTVEVPAPIYQTAAYDEGRVFFGAEDMRAYALDAERGERLWTSEKLSGMSFRDYYPLVYQGVVWLEAAAPGSSGVTPVFPLVDRYGPDRQQKLADWLAKHGTEIREGRMPEEAQRDLDQAFESMIREHERRSETRVRTLLDARTGKRLPLVPVSNRQVMCGAPQPPAVDRDGRLVIPVEFVAGTWARVTVQPPRLVDLLYSYDPANALSSPGMGNADETLNVSAGGPWIFTVHAQENNAHYNGAFNLDERRWYPLPSGIPSPWSTHPMVHSTETGNNAASVAYGAVYHQGFHTVHNWVPK